MRIQARGRLSFLATAVVALSFFSACGGESKPDTLLEVLRSFNAALARGDGKRACELLSDSKRKEIIERAASQHRDCPEQLASLSKPGNIEAPAVKSLSSAELGRVSYAGDVATVEVTSGQFGTGIAQLERQANGEWRVIETAAATGFF